MNDRHTTRTAQRTSCWMHIGTAVTLALAASTSFGQGGTTCATAELVAAGDHTYGAMVASTPSGCLGNTMSRWYRFTAPSTGTVLVKSCSATTNTTLNIRSSCAGGCGTSSGDDGDVTCHPLGANSSLSAVMTSGEDILIEWGNPSSDAAADFTIYFAPVGGPAPAGDNCSNAIDLGTQTSPLVANTSASGVSADFSIACGTAAANPARDLIYYIDVPASAVLTIGQSMNCYDSQHYLRYGGSCPGATAIICYDDDFGETGTEVWTNSTGVTQRVWWIQDGYSSAAGCFTLAWSLASSPACTENVTLELRTDANSQQASWEILAQNTNTVLCSGGGYPPGITSPITEGCCLPVGCYRLRVVDGGGDGFVTGGYQLRESGPTGRRIIDNFGNFTTGSVSALAATYDNGAFCVPLGNDRPIFSSCDKLDWVNNQFIVATENVTVSAQYGVTNTTSGYEFWFNDPNGTYSYRRFRNHATSDGFGTGATRACHFKLNSWANSGTTPHILANTLMNVRIRGRLAGNNLPFGPACLFKIDAVRAACPLVKLQDNPLNVSDYSCGVTRTFGGASSPSNRIVANPPQFSPAVSGSLVRYQFRFRIPGEGICIVRPAQTSPTLVMNWATGQLLECTKTYQVDVRVSKDGGATWCIDTPGPTCTPVTPWGKVCNVTISTSTFCPSFQGGSSNLAGESTGNLTMYPNPNRGDQLFLSLSEVPADVHTVSVDIFDMTGKRVVARTLAVQDGFVKTNVELNGDLAGGLYLVNITAGGQHYTERLVISR